LGLREQLRVLIDLEHEGSIRKAAAALEESPRTLAAIVSGQVKHPRADLVERIAKKKDVSVDWLLTGKGKGPEDRTEFDPDMPWAELLEWAALVDSLAEPGPVRDALFRLPFTLQLAGSEHLNPNFTAEALAEGYNYGAFTPKHLLALKYAVLSWTAFLKGLRENLRPEWLDQWLRDRLLELQLGYNPVALRLFRDEVISREKVAEVTNEPAIEGSLVERIRRLRQEDEELQESIRRAIGEGYLVPSPPRRGRRSPPKKRR
jgi:hypothetical protein